MKCLPSSKVAQAQGNVLHDWHAEVLAIRAFNRFLIDECADLAVRGVDSKSQWLRWRENGIQQLDEGANMRHANLGTNISETGWEGQVFAIQENVKIHMYCSEAPCGDASMELTMAEQEDATPWPTSDAASSSLLGRSGFAQLAIVRRKPSRPDAPPTLSKSCSDKLALKQCTSLLSSLTSTLIHPGNAYLSTLVLPASQHISDATNRAFGVTGRLSPLAKKTWPTGYRFRPFQVMTTKAEFSYSKRANINAVPSNLSALFTPGRSEILINGVLQGRKQVDPRGASCVSRRGLWMAVLSVALGRDIPAYAAAVLGKRLYGELKESELLECRQRVKHEVQKLALKGWTKNLGDEDWTLL